MHYSSKSLYRAAFSALLGLTVLASTSALAQTTAVRGKAIPAKPSFPTLRFNEMNNRENAIAKLGANLPAVAARYGKTAAEFTSQLRADPSAWIDKNGHLLYAEKALTTSGSNLAPSGAIYPPEQTFLLHSRPGSKRKIYLDFNGHTTTGTEWNSSYGVDPIISPALDLDGVPGTFAASETAMIQNIWRRVSEDYAPFDVDVTTEEPPADQLNRLPLIFNDDAYGMRVVITKDFTAATAKGWCGCGGHAYVGVFDEPGIVRKPAFVYYDHLSYSEKTIAEAISHEVGHTLGLSHDGTYVGYYYYGHGDGATGWAPIMGVGYDRELVQFSKGEYAHAANTEDDFQVMQNNGVQFAADDFGNTIATAATLSGTLANGVSTYDARGLIESPLDIDVFKFVSSAGTVTISAAPFELSPNLDIRLQVRNASGVLLAESNPIEALNASLSVALPVAGSYYVSVQGTGKGDPLTTGYTNYGSIGRYAFRVTAPLTASAPSCAITVTNRYVNTSVTTVKFSGSGSSDVSGPIQSYQWDFGDFNGYASGVTAMYSYYVSGSYMTKLTVTNSAGLSSSCYTTTNVVTTGDIP